MAKRRWRPDRRDGAGKERWQGVDAASAHRRNEAGGRSDPRDDEARREARDGVRREALTPGEPGVVRVVAVSRRRHPILLLNTVYGRRVGNASPAPPVVELIRNGRAKTRKMPHSAPADP